MTRPEAPDLFALPPAPLDDAELTPAENPIAKMIEVAVGRAMAPVADRIIAAINGVGHRLTVLELVQKADHAARLALEERVELLERHCFPTMPCAPPEGAE